MDNVTAVSVSLHAHRKQNDLAACINYRVRHMLANRRKQTSSNLSQSTTLFLLVAVGAEGGGGSDRPTLVARIPDCCINTAIHMVLKRKILISH